MTTAISTGGKVKAGASRTAKSMKASKRAFGLVRRTAFYTDMAAFMAAKLPPFQALQDMVVIARKRRSSRPLAAVYQAVIAAMDRGADLSIALSKFVPGAEAVMLAGAEKAGPEVLQKAFAELGVLLDRQQRARAKLRGALIAGGIQLAVIVGMVVFVTEMIVPQLSAGITPDMLPNLSFALSFFAFGRGLMTLGPFVAMAVVGIGVWVSWSLPRWTRNWRYWSRTWFDRHLMPWTLYVRAQATFFLSSAASMMRAGIPLKQVVTDMMPFATPWMRKHLRTTLKALQAGRSETESLGSGCLPEDTSDRLAIYQRLPDFTQIMTRLAEDNFVRYEKAIDAMSATLRAICMLLLGLFIVSLLFAIFNYTNALYGAVRAARAAAGG
ncbi:MAG: type II secretion system F family protein [Rhodanobacter sp.]